MEKSKFQLVGSLLRPQNLLDYKNQIEERDDITYPFYDAFDGYKETESNAITQVIQEQLAHHIDVLTDGEYSKSMWHLDFLWGLHGVERFILMARILKHGKTLGFESLHRYRGKIITF
jgi:methionine synthase II (cobalamin-independent)